MTEHGKFLIQQNLLLVLSFFILWNFFPVGGWIDLELIYPWINDQGQFPLRQHWALVELNHRYVKDILIISYVFMLLAWMASFKGHKRLHWRWQYGYFFCMVIVSTCFIGLLKSQSAHACPWDMITPTDDGILWDFSASNGHCFPGGHASSGFALIAGYFIYRLSERKRAYFFLFSALILGFALGWAQMMRGAHFFSHNLWSAWIIWCLNVIGYTLFSDKFSVQPSDHRIQDAL